MASIEAKQVAQQEAERAKYEVEQAKEAKKSIIIQAEASAKSIELVGQAAINNPCKTYIYTLGYLDVRKIEYTKKIAEIISESRNHILLNSNLLNMEFPSISSH